MSSKSVLSLFVFLTFFSSLYSQTSIRSLFQDGNKIWIGTNYGMYVENEKEFEWQYINHGLPDDSEIILMEKYQNRLYGADQQGRLFSISESDTVWKKNNSLSSQFKQIISIRKNDTALFVIDMEMGIAYTTDEGLIWNYLDYSKKINANKIKDTETQNNVSTKKNKSEKKKDETNVIHSNQLKITDLYFLESEILVGVSSSQHGFGLYKSNDNGKTWQEASFDLSNLNVKKIYRSKDKLYLITSGMNAAIYQSKNNGINWEKLTKPPITWLTLFSATDSKLYVGNRQGDLCVSDDDGITWEKLDYSKSETEQSFNQLIKTNNGLYLGTTDGIIIMRENHGKCEIIKEGFKTKKIDSFFYAGIGTINGVTLHASKFSDKIIFKVENKTSRKVKVEINMIFECEFLNNGINQTMPKQKIDWLIAVEPNSTISYETDPKSCSVSSCEEKTKHWEITNWKVNH